MSGTFTTTVETARELLKMYQARGLIAFLEVLRSHADVVADDLAGDLKEMNARFAATLYGILAVLYVNDSDRIIRRQLALMETYSGETDPVRKAAAFVQGVGGFLKTYEEERKSRSLSETVKLFLASCSLKELRALTVQTVAEKFGYNTNYLSNRFRQEQDLTLQEALQNEKLNRAYLALKDVEARLTVKELSWNLGFIDAAYFSQLFKTRFGLLPTQVRQCG
ncbi:MAG: helix-turn-helix transcriptional regulator [Acidobacteria bacterium]|nr:helix-turn-helix transcriptional regulator [Acidobacteriota bacterium]